MRYSLVAASLNQRAFQPLMNNSTDRGRESRINRTVAITNQSRPLTIEERIEEVVEQTIRRVLGPYLAKLAAPDPVVYTVSQSPDMMHRISVIGPA